MNPSKGYVTFSLSENGIEVPYTDIIPLEVLNSHATIMFTKIDKADNTKHEGSARIEYRGKTVIGTWAKIGVDHTFVASIQGIQ